MDSLKGLLRTLDFLKLFENDWAKLIALVLVLGTLLLLNYITTQINLVIILIFGTVVMYIKLHFDYQKHKENLRADVEKAKMLYVEEEKNHRDDSEKLL